MGDIEHRGHKVGVTHSARVNPEDIIQKVRISKVLLRTSQNNTHTTFYVRPARVQTVRSSEVLTY